MLEISLVAWSQPEDDIYQKYFDSINIPGDKLEAIDGVPLQKLLIDNPEKYAALSK